MDMENFIRRKTNIVFNLNNFDICMYYSSESNNFTFLVQLFIIVGKFHIAYIIRRNGQDPSPISFNFFKRLRTTAPVWRTMLIKKQRRL